MKKIVSIILSVLMISLLISCNSNDASKATEKNSHTYTKTEFQQYLTQLSEEEEDGEQTIHDIQILDDQTIKVVLNNHDSGTYSNMLIIDTFDTAIRQHYKQSDYYSDTEPEIRFLNLDGELVMDSSTPVDFTANEVGGF
ncbi:MAG: hypothetical protein ACI35P_14690 [Bacillus sp. (in: firmicutes)]